MDQPNNVLYVYGTIVSLQVSLEEGTCAILIDFIGEIITQILLHIQLFLGKYVDEFLLGDHKERYAPKKDSNPCCLRCMVWWKQIFCILCEGPME